MFNPNATEMTRPDRRLRQENTASKPGGSAKLVCGCGYLGERIARRWIAAGHEVWATTRSAARAGDLSQIGLRPIVVDMTHPFTFPTEMPRLGTVLWAVGFDRSVGQSIEDVYVGGMRNLLEALPSGVERLVYISSTGVYGQPRAEWVDEQTPCEPTRAGGRACLAAEQLLAGHPLGRGRMVLRLAGIYGPGRIPKMAAIQAGEAIESTESGYLNLIYVDDAVEAVLAAERDVQPPDLFVISDGHPVLRGEFYRELARLLKAPSPRFAAPPLGSSTAERATSDKRVSNRRMLASLRVSLRFPSYREGLAEIVT
jgi:nucleoside-diphosphate-sugar epimerase